MESEELNVERFVGFYRGLMKIRVLVGGCDVTDALHVMRMNEN